MKIDTNEKERYIKAREKVRHIKVFYFHLIGYFIVVALLLYNLYILDETNVHAEFFTWFNSIIIVAWTVFIILHGRWALQGKTFFKKSWEEKKAKTFLENESKEETTFWE